MTKNLERKDFERIADAINYLHQHAVEQPSLDELANAIHLSSHHFHRLFVRYCGVTPKQFLQVLTVKTAKQLLLKNHNTTDTALSTGLSGNSRLYDHFIKIEAITPGEFKSQGEGIHFYWGTGRCQFGDAIIIWTDKGIHRLEFNTHSDSHKLINTLHDQWPAAQIIEDQSTATDKIEKIFSGNHGPLNLWIKGTNFQINVWRALLNIAPGRLSTYQNIANAIKKPTSSRPVGTAIGNNPVAFLIPCHRVIQSSGALGGYRWSPARKHVMLTSEILQREDYPAVGNG